MMDEKLASMINYQINKELESAYLYLDFSNYFREKGLCGFGHWYLVQAREEVEHAEKFMEYLHDEDETVELTSIDMLEFNWISDLDVLESGMKHEMYITRLINSLYDEAEKLKDYRTLNFLEWFIAEQAEEEKSAGNLIRRYRLFADKDSCGLLHLDAELGNR